MFLKVKIDNKTLIINLGSDLSQASSLVEMFEKNAVVVEESYSHVGVVNVTSTIELGSEIKFEKSSYGGEETNVIITAESDIVGCVNADANTFIDVNLINKKHMEQLSKLKKEIETLNATVTHLNSKIEALEEQED
jgi:prefoldin subunit 5